MKKNKSHEKTDFEVQNVTVRLDMAQILNVLNFKNTYIQFGSLGRPCQLMWKQCRCCQLHWPMHLYFSALSTVYAANQQLSRIIPLMYCFLLSFHAVSLLGKKLRISKWRTAKCFTCLFHLKSNAFSYTQPDTWQTYWCLAKLFVEWKVGWIYADSTVVFVHSCVLRAWRIS